MTKQEVLDSLRNFSSDFPKRAIKEVQANRLEYTSDLLESLDYVYKNAYELSERGSEYYLHMYAMFLLAEFREKKAFPYLTKLLTLPEDFLDIFMGDTLTEDFCRVLLSTYDDENIHLLSDIIENQELYEFARKSAVKAYGLLYAEGRVTQEDYISYLRSLIYSKLPADRFDPIFTAIADSIIDVNLLQMIPDVRFLYDNEKIDTSIIGEYESFLDFMDRKEHEKQRTYVSDAIAEMEWWACFKHARTKISSIELKDGLGDFTTKKSMEDRKQDQKLLQKQKKVGRNDPCPCGSGKKHKNCCLNLPRNSRPYNQVVR